MDLQTKFPAGFFRFLAAGVFCCCFLSACKYTVPVVMEDPQVLDACTDDRVSYSFDYDAEVRNVNFFRHDWRLVRKKGVPEKIGEVRQKSNNFAFSEAWLQRSLWSGKYREDTRYLMIPPLFLYPLVDTAVLATCFVGDLVVFPVKFVDEMRNVPRSVPPADEEEVQNEVFMRIVMQDNTSYTDMAEDKVTKKLAKRPVVFSDMGREFTLVTDEYGSVALGKAIRYALPERKITMAADDSVDARNGIMFFNSSELLWPHQKADFVTLCNKKVSKKIRLEALERLADVFEPAAFEREKQRLNSLLY